MLYSRQVRPGNFQFTNIFTAGLSAAGTPMANTGNSFASFLLGQVTRFSIDAQSEILKPRATIAEFFLQDDWRATRRLTVNLGVRYTLNFPSTVADDQGAVFNLQTQKLDYFGQNGFPRSARNLEKLNFGPRVGLAYQADRLLCRSFGLFTRLDRAGRNHDALHHTAVSIHSDAGTADARQHQSSVLCFRRGRRLCRNLQSPTRVSARASSACSETTAAAMRSNGT